jgi:chromosome segregation ATPase
MSLRPSTDNGEKKTTPSASTSSKSGYESDDVSTSLDSLDLASEPHSDDGNSEPSEYCPCLSDCEESLSGTVPDRSQQEEDLESKDDDSMEDLSADKSQHIKELVKQLWAEHNLETELALSDQESKIQRLQIRLDHADYTITDLKAQVKTLEEREKSLFEGYLDVEERCRKIDEKYWDIKEESLTRTMKTTTENHHLQNEIRRLEALIINPTSLRSKTWSVALQGDH